MRGIKSLKGILVSNMVMGTFYRMEVSDGYNYVFKFHSIENNNDTYKIKGFDQWQDLNENYIHYHTDTFSVIICNINGGGLYSTDDGCRVKFFEVD
jgi:hypothetical protein